MSRDYDSEMKDGINKYNYTFDDKMNRFKVKKLLEIIDTSNVENVLEVGCFEGGMTKVLNEYFADVDVVEPSRTCVEKMKAAGYENTFICEILENYETEKRYNLIIISHTLEHIRDRTAALKKAESLLAPGGYLYVVVPNGTSISRLIAHNLKLLPYPCCVTDGEREHGHFITYDLYTLERDARSTDLEIVSKGGIVLKVFGNKQYDSAFQHGIVDDAFLEACFQLGKERPLDCASIYFLGQKR